jgi:3-methyl-2-oxobutanoate hydroxymethyltransferase
MKWTVKKIRESKGKEPLPTITAYDAITARMADEAGMPLILVGDSLGTTSLGFETTVPVTMEIMLHHTKAVRKGAKNSLIVADLPFLSYQINDDEAIRNAGRFLQEAGADAVKLEGGEMRAPLIKKLVDNGIPVMAHLGVLPQSVKESGYAAKGRTDEDFERLKKDILAINNAGAFCVVLECVTSDAACELTKISTVPTIGIGSGNGCDGQIIVISDLLGMIEGPVPKFVKKYAEFASTGKSAIEDFIADVKSRVYPGEEHTYK